MTSGNVVVLGSANADLVVEVERRPQGGETLLGSDLRIYPGGKGANQAAASARAGAKTVFLGCVGQDDHGRLLRHSLDDAGVDTSSLCTSGAPTGTALIFLTPDGENSIVVSPGANSSVDEAMLKDTTAVWGEASALVISMEIPRSTIEKVIPDAGARGVRIVLNAAPARALGNDMLRWCDPLVVNEHEAAIVLDEDHDDPAELARRLLGKGARSVIVTLGADGALVADEGGIASIPAHRVTAVDTTGAGDAFVGAVACELAHGRSLQDAVRFATAMSAVAVQRMGAQSSYASRPEVEAFIAGDTPPQT